MINQCDYYAWIQQQISLLRAKRFDKIDLEQLIEEIESMGHLELAELESRFTILLTYLLKWQYQANPQTHNWILVVNQQRRRVIKTLQQNPSLNNKLKEIIADAYDIAKGDVADEIGLPESNFPKKCPWKYAQIMDMRF